MTYTSLPNSGQSLGQTRAAIKKNFDLIKTTLDQNHVDLDLANQGKHYVVQMPVTATIPVAPLPPGGLVAGEANLYSKNSSAASQIFFSPDASGNEYQMTRAISASFTSFGQNLNNYGGIGADYSGGWTFLPGGMIYQYGSVVNAYSHIGATLTFPVAFTNAPYSISLILQRADSASAKVIVKRSPAPTNTGFNYDIDVSGTLTTLYWVAIGV